MGTLQVAGDVNLAAGSTYAVELTPTSSDQIVATGKAILGGGTEHPYFEGIADLRVSAHFLIERDGANWLS